MLSLLLSKPRHQMLRIMSLRMALLKEFSRACCLISAGMTSSVASVDLRYTIGNLTV
jgi:hypothetical protein